MVNNFISKLADYFSLVRGQISKIKLRDLSTTIQNRYRDLRLKIQDLPKTNFDLALYHFQRGSLNDAIFRFKLLKMFKAPYPTCDYYLAKCYIEKFRYDKAAPFLAAYMRSGDQQLMEEAIYCSHIIERTSHHIRVIPPTILKHNLDKVAHYLLSKAAVNSLDHDRQASEFDLLNIHLQESEKMFNNNILDIGCKEGGMGQLCREGRVANIINGTEISPIMVARVSSLTYDTTKTYTKVLNCQDFTAYLKGLKAKGHTIYDVLILSDFITYFTDLVLIFSAAKKILNSGGFMLISFKCNDTAQDHAFIPQLEQFYYNKQYVAAAAGENGFKVLQEAEITFSGAQKGVVMMLRS